MHIQYVIHGLNKINMNVKVYLRYFIENNLQINFHV